MIRNLTLTGFRAFDNYVVHDLGRVNLLVGPNNCGKTSILEAVELFGSRGDLFSLYRVTSRRGERIQSPTSPRNYYALEADVCHLFHGHDMELNSKFSVKADTEFGIESLSISVVENSHHGQRELFTDQADDERTIGEFINEPNLALEIKRKGSGADRTLIPLSPIGGINSDVVRRSSRPRSLDDAPRVRFVSTAGLTIDEVIEMFEEIVLTRKEDLVIEAMRTIQPNIERLATVSSDRRRSNLGERGGIVIKLEGSAQRIPIGSMGDGMWRMLGLALSLVSAENGILLVDEVDTGLHFTVMEKMWKLIDKTAQRLNVQVFATTHSRDAYESLAAIARETVSDESNVTIQRIDRQRGKSVAFTEQEIVASADRGMEVR